MPSALLIKYVESEKVTSGGESYKEITDARSFCTYEEAEAYVGDQTSGNYRVVGTDPFSSPAPLEDLNSYELIYPLEATTTAATLKNLNILAQASPEFKTIPKKTTSP